MENKKPIFITGTICLIVGIILLCMQLNGPQKEKTLEQLMSKVKVEESNPVKASVNLTDTSLYDELPEITKYPLVVTGKGDINIEIFSSGEKAAKTGTDSWLTTVANDFNRSNIKTANGKPISISVRSISSGLAADYIISGKYLPDLYTPSNELFGEYAIANHGNLELYEKRLVGNTAGLLVKNKSPHKTAFAVLDTVMNGETNIGYTNPQTSATGLNLLIDLLKTYGDGDVTSVQASDTFSKFNNNIPFVAYTTQQMATSASNGSLDGMVTEYQAYINDKNLKNNYKFIPFGLRHDNPLYIVNKNNKTEDELEAIEIIKNYLLSSNSQNIATKDGFNENNDYKDSYETNGTEIIQSLKVYKKSKDSGKDIIAVFVADCSGSMDGEPINQLKESLSNGMQYINENNQVGLVSYSSKVTIEVPIDNFDLNQKSYFQGAIDNLYASGSTYSYEAVCTGLQMIEEARKQNPNAKCMLFLLTDGYANGNFKIKDIESAILNSEVPIYTIGYTSDADMDSLKKLSGINEAATINADSDDIVYKIKSLFNAQL